MLKMVQVRIATGVTTVVCTAVVLRCAKQMEKLPHYHFSWTVSFQNQRYHIREMLPLQTKQSGGELLSYDKECKEQKEHHSYKNGTWKVRTLKQGGKLENLKTEMRKNEVRSRCQ